MGLGCRDAIHLSVIAPPDLLAAKGNIGMEDAAMAAPARKEIPPISKAVDFVGFRGRLHQWEGARGQWLARQERATIHGKDSTRSREGSLRRQWSRCASLSMPLWLGEYT